MRARSLALLLLLTSSRPPPPAEPPPRLESRGQPRSGFTLATAAGAAPGRRWSRVVLDRMTLPAKAAQMIAVRAEGLGVDRASARARRLRRRVREMGVGGVVVFDAEVQSLPRLLNGLQAEAEVPLLVAADMERGMSFRLRRGVVPLPYAMAVGATRSEEAARFTGEVAAREGRALGVHWAFAPVADVNNNPANPVINIRSYGEDPELAARLAAAFVRGARSGGLLTTAKHFPGHGDTAVDSHLRLPRIEASRERLERLELLPFRRVVDSGVDSVMMGHIAVPALDPTGAPATLSPQVADVLRRALGFRGLVVTDALDMAGAGGRWTGEGVVRAVAAGADLVVLPPDAEAAVAALVAAVRRGLLDMERIDASVARILDAKERLGLHRVRTVDPEALEGRVARPEDVDRALSIARASLTLVRNHGAVLPLRTEEPLRLLHLVLSSDARNDAVQGIPERELAVRWIEAETVTLGPEVPAGAVEALVARVRAGGFTHVLASCFVRVTGAKGTADMSPRHARLLRALAGAGPPLVVVSFGSPYLLLQFPEAPVYVCAYGGAESSQRAAVAALFGEHDVGGRLPVTLPGLHPYGHGIRLARRPLLRVAAQTRALGPLAPPEVGALPAWVAAPGAFLLPETSRRPGGLRRLTATGRRPR